MFILTHRATEQTRAKLKELTDSIHEAVSNLPQSEGLLKSSALSSQPEPMDIPIEAETPHSTVTSEFVDPKDAELCTLIDSLITSTNL